MTKADLEKSAKIDSHALKRWNYTSPSDKELISVANVLDLSPEDLFGKVDT